MKKRIEENSIENAVNTIATRLNDTQYKLFKIKAIEKNYTTSELLREIILKYLDKDMSHENLLQASMVNTMKKIDQLNDKTEFFQQLFYCWLSQWFLTHPKLEEKNQNIIIKNSIVRRNEFISRFIGSVYDQNQELYEILFANKAENEETKE